MSNPDFASPPEFGVGDQHGAAAPHDSAADHIRSDGDHVGGARRRSRRSTLFWAVLVAVVVAVVGSLLGWVWAELAPRIAVIKVDGGFVYADAEPEQAVAGDGWFALLGLAVGLIFAVAAWVLLRRHRGIAVLLGLVAGSIVGALLSWWVGYRIGFREFHHSADLAAIGTRLDAPLNLRLAHVDPKAWWKSRPTGVAAVQALSAALVYTCLAGFSANPHLRPDESADPNDPASPDAAVDFLTVDPRTVDQFGPGVTGSSDTDSGTARI